MKRLPVPAVLIPAAIFSFAVVAVAPFFGTESIDGGSAWAQLLSSPRSTWSLDARILDLRLPRVALGWLAGAALAVSGALLQTLLRNGLATPYTLGVSGAGAFGAFLFLAFPGLAVALEPVGTPRTGALVFSLLEILLVLWIAKHSRRVDALLLAGVTFNFLFGAGMMFVRYLADPYRLQSMERWLLGGLDVVTWSHPVSLLPWILFGLLLIAIHAKALDQIAFDEEMAAARGVSVAFVRNVSVVGAGVLTAAVVSHTGPIGFVGLLVPHAVRPFTGMRHRALLPAAGLLGGGFLVLADMAARTIPALGRSAELPVGIVTAMIGGPFFLLLLLRTSD